MTVKTLPQRLDAWDAQQKDAGWALDVKDVVKWAVAAMEADNPRQEIAVLVNHLTSPPISYD